MDIFQNIILIFIGMLLLGILVAFSILLEKFMELSEEVHRKLFELDITENDYENHE